MIVGTVGTKHFGVNTNGLVIAEIRNNPSVIFHNFLHPLVVLENGEGEKKKTEFILNSVCLFSKRGVNRGVKMSD